MSAASPSDRSATFNPDSELWRPRMLLPDLFGKVIVLDPAGGGTNTDGTYPLGSRGADLNLETARQAKNLLEGAGARVFLTRKDEVAPDPREKVLLSGRTQADLFLTLGQSPAGQHAKVMHHPGSRVGISWAAAMKESASGLDSLTVKTSYAYLLRHTACPALEVRWSAPATARQELQRTSLAWHNAQARAVVLACAAAFSPEGHLPVSVSPEDLIANIPATLPLNQIEWARWDGNFFWQPSSFQEGRIDLDSLQGPGWPAQGDIHTLEIHGQGLWQIWRVDFTPNGIQYGLMMENR